MTIFTTKLLSNSFSNVLHLLKSLIDCHTTLFIYLFIVVKSTFNLFICALISIYFWIILEYLFSLLWYANV